MSIYVRFDNEEVDKWKVKFFESMGGQSHVSCQCCNFPLIPTNKNKAEKLQCNIKKYYQDNISEIETISTCTRKEAFVCSNINCNLRICRKCYKTFPEDKTTIVIPEYDASHVIDKNNYVNNNNSNNKESSMSSLEDSTVEEEEDVDTENFIENHVVFSNQDTSFDQTEDNIPEKTRLFYHTFWRFTCKYISRQK